jgi:hypothetical protein
MTFGGYTEINHKYINIFMIWHAYTNKLGGRRPIRVNGDARMYFLIFLCEHPR